MFPEWYGKEKNDSNMFLIKVIRAIKATSWQFHFVHRMSVQ